MVNESRREKGTTDADAERGRPKVLAVERVSLTARRSHASLRIVVEVLSEPTLWSPNQQSENCMSEDGR